MSCSEHAHFQREATQFPLPCFDMNDQFSTFQAYFVQIVCRLHRCTSLLVNTLLARSTRAHYQGVARHYAQFQASYRLGVAASCTAPLAMLYLKLVSMYNEKDAAKRAIAQDEVHKLFAIVKTRMREIAPDLKYHAFYRFHPSISPGIQEFVEALTLYEYALNKRLLPLTEAED